MAKLGRRMSCRIKKKPRNPDSDIEEASDDDEEEREEEPLNVKTKKGCCLDLPFCPCITYIQPAPFFQLGLREVQLSQNLTNWREANERLEKTKSSQKNTLCLPRFQDSTPQGTPKTPVTSSNKNAFYFKSAKRLTLSSHGFVNYIQAVQASIAGNFDIYILTAQPFDFLTLNYSTSQFLNLTIICPFYL